MFKFCLRYLFVVSLLVLQVHGSPKPSNEASIVDDKGKGGFFNIFDMLLDYFYDGDDDYEEETEEYLICRNCTVVINRNNKTQNVNGDGVSSTPGAMSTATPPAATMPITTAPAPAQNGNGGGISSTPGAMSTTTTPAAQNGNGGAVASTASPAPASAQNGNGGEVASTPAPVPANPEGAPGAGAQPGTAPATPPSDQSGAVPSSTTENGQGAPSTPDAGTPPATALVPGEDIPPSDTPANEGA